MIVHMQISKFREFGFLQEINRQFLHPIGMALEIIVDDETGEESLGSVIATDDPEGIIFAPYTIDEEKAAFVKRFQKERIAERLRRLGYVIQPICYEVET